MENNFTKYLVYIIVICIIASLCSLLLYMIIPDIFDSKIRYADDIKQNMNNSTELSRLFWILSNNASMGFIIMSMSITRYKFVPGGAIFYNAFVLSGLVFAAYTKLGALALLYGFVPHASVEIPAIMIGGVFAFLAVDKFNEMNIKYSYHVIPKVSRKTLNEVIFRPYFTIVFPFILLSAIIEAFVSFNLLRSML